MACERCLSFTCVYLYYRLSAGREVEYVGSEASPCNLSLAVLFAIAQLFLRKHSLSFAIARLFGPQGAAGPIPTLMIFAYWCQDLGTITAHDPRIAAVRQAEG